MTDLSLIETGFNGGVYHGEKGYIQLIEDIIKKGVRTSTNDERTGTGTISLFDAKVIYGPGEMCFSTIRPASLWLAFEEFWFFMRGETQTKKLEEKGISFWKGNTSRAFLDARGLTHLEEGDMGEAYGFQWRGYNKNISDQVVDQLAETINTLKSDTFSRRVLTSFWNPSASKRMALTPCWYENLLSVSRSPVNGKLYLHMRVGNRSLDALFGYSFAVQQYRLYQLCLAKMMGFELGAMVADLGNTHLYLNQIEYASELIGRELGQQGSISLNKELKTLDDMLSLEFEDFTIEGLKVNHTPFTAKKPPMAV